MLTIFTLVSFLFCLIVSAQANNDTFPGMTASSQLRGFHAGGVPNSYRQPAVAGTTIIMLCEAAFLEGDKGLQFRQGFKHLSWKLRSQNGTFTFLGGMNSTGSVSIHSDPQKYAIGSKTCSLTIYNVAKADETEYKYTVSHQANQDSEPDESFVKLDVIEIPESVQSTKPGPEPYPVMPGTTNWLLCSPLLDKKNIAQAGWFILQNNSWSWIAGVGRPAKNTTDSWEYLLSKEYTRYGFFGSNFLEIRNVTKEDNGSIYRCRIVTWDGHPKSVYFKLQVLELKEAPPSTTTSAPTPAAPTTTPQPPDHDRDVDMYCECTGWKIGFALLCVLLIAITAVVIVWKIRRYHTADQARRVDNGPENVNAVNESHRYVVNDRNGIGNGNVNYGEKCGSEATLDDDNDGDVPMLKP